MCQLGRRRFFIMDNKVNHSIKCSVSSCAYHANSQNYCTLNEIKVGCSTPNVTDCGCTECASFQAGSGKGCCR